MIEAVIFDMDGLLIDSEPLWHEAEIEAFKKVGIHLTKKDCLETTGFRIDEVVAHRYYKQPWQGMSQGEMVWEVTANIIGLIKEKGELKPGAENALQFARRRAVKIALASSSDYAVIDAALEKFKWTDQFEVVYSAEDEDYGKPHPAVYLTTCRKLGVDPQTCLAIEDSLPGVIAAKAAKMWCIAVPENENEKFVLADVVLKSLHELNDEVWARIDIL
jgi:HAD superfamily hydrolase (TIGR01509 family)